MAARRLLILMLVLLAVSTLAAALVPQQGEREETPSNGGTAATEPRPEQERSRPPPGTLVRRTIEVAPHGADEIELRRGDQLALTVRSGAADQVEIPAFGQLEDLTPEDPARFNLLPERTGVFEVRLLAARRVIGRIRVRPPR
jgi:Flp pilus assembly protein CpaB